MKLGNIDKNSTYYTDPKIKKLRWASNILTIAGILMFLVLFLLWKDEYTEIEVEGISTFFKMPFIIVIGAILCFIVSGILHYIAIGKSVIKEIKSDDNPFLKQ